MRYVLNCALYEVYIPENIDHFLQVRTSCIEVKKCKGGWKPIRKDDWLGQIPIKAKLIK